MAAKIKIGIVGAGNMGEAVAERLKKDYSVYIFDKDKHKLENFNVETQNFASLHRVGIFPTETLAELLSKVAVVILAVKPQDFDRLLTEIKASGENKLIISIAAGIPTVHIEQRLGQVKVIRVMPNLAVKIGQGMSCLCKGKFAGSADLAFVEKIFKHLGRTLILKEAMLDAATAVSGSGPGFFYAFLEAKGRDFCQVSGQEIQGFQISLQKAAWTLGFSRKYAGLLAKATVSGAQAMLQATNLTPTELRKQVASKGGTTEAALQILDKGGSLQEAVKAALNRARGLSKKLKVKRQKYKLKVKI